LRLPWLEDVEDLIRYVASLTDVQALKAYVGFWHNENRVIPEFVIEQSFSEDFDFQPMFTSQAKCADDMDTVISAMNEMIL